MTDAQSPVSDIVPSKNKPDWIPIFLLGFYFLILLFVIISPLEGLQHSQNGTANIPSSFASIKELDFPTLSVILYLVGVIFFGFGIWVLLFRWKDEIGQTVAFLLGCGALFFAGLIPLQASPLLQLCWGIVVALFGATWLHLTMMFIKEQKLLWLKTVIYPLSLVLVLVSSWLGYSVLVFSIWLTLTNIIFMGACVYRYFSPRSVIEKEQMQRLLIGYILSLLPALLWLTGISLGIPAATKKEFSFLLLSLIIFPPFLANTILNRIRLQGAYLLSNTLLYSSLAVIVSLSYVLIVTGLNLLFYARVSLQQSPLLVGMATFLISMIIYPLHKGLKNYIGAHLIPDREIYAQKYQSFNRELLHFFNLEALTTFTVSYLQDFLNISRLQLYVYNAEIAGYAAINTRSEAVNGDLRFSKKGDKLVQYLHQTSNVLSLQETFSFPEELKTEKARLALMGAELLIALPGNSQINGWLALGPRRTGERYTQREITFLSDIARQLSATIERVQIIAENQTRVQSMNVLTRVAQGINITLDFDDMLELIYAQIGKILPADDFNITLYSVLLETLSHVFYLENSERLPRKENRMIPATFGLEGKILKSGLSINTEDYLKACRRQQVTPAREGVFAWVGVPLNAGTETIGVVAVGTRNPEVVYTSEQVNILQAVADQAAGAIVKMRLLAESEKRARQLSTLNELVRSLTSTLDLDTLLKRILTSATDILNCEAGSLLLLDKETSDLVFEVTTGPVADELIGKRMGSNVGLVGKAVQTGEPVIVNNVEQSEDWFSQPDKRTGFESKGILVVPMIHKEEVIGVIEVLNKKDGMPFDKDDTELLMAFSSQAAIAVDNTRLYTLTDQALASRVEELSVMQRIDRELNASLDVERSMMITLEWAMRQSDSAAGFIGVLHENQMDIVASEGYRYELDEYHDPGISLENTAFQKVIQGELFHLSGIAEANGRDAFFLQGSASQVVLPVRRETDVLGLMVLESTIHEHYGQDILAFLTRLCDHAAIAISNAQLYSAVQQANIAKSEFVSFVSHELKNPMTSIRGYTDLLASGVVGEVNEAQGNFLSTIRDNVNRMTTLVSDLADVSRIEAGRLRLDFSVASIAKIIEEVLVSLKNNIEDKRQQLEVDIPDDLPLIWGDPSRLLQILTNIISNAHKYTPEGGRIIIQAEHVANHWDSEGAVEVVHIIVTDTGIGIKEEDQANIFQQYFRTEYSKETASGTGLGLNITHTLVEMQGGKIWFESIYGEGTHFHFTIPIAEMDVEGRL